MDNAPLATYENAQAANIALIASIGKQSKEMGMCNGANALSY